MTLRPRLITSPRSSGEAIGGGAAAAVTGGGEALATAVIGVGAAPATAVIGVGAAADGGGGRPPNLEGLIAGYGRLGEIIAIDVTEEQR